MKTMAILVLLLAFSVGGFVAGRWRSQRHAPDQPGRNERQILYYVDPMNPTHISDRPGLAPCGMKLEPVYADNTPDSIMGNLLGTLAPDSVRISLERQQLAGIQTTQAGVRALSYGLRLPGRVVVDETRLYRIKAAVSGYIGRAFPLSTGSLVQKDEVLAELNSPELLPAVQSLLFALESRVQPKDAAASDLAVTNSVFEFDLSYQQSLETLRHMGMGQRQLDELIRTRKLVKSIDISSPANGVLLARQASHDLHVAMGEELFRVADLSRIWILTDVLEWELDYLKPGKDVLVSLPHQAKAFTASISKALPLFDEDLRTLQIRLELDNPNYALRPDMFVDVELSITLPEMILISIDAVLDTGNRTTVFLDRGGGCFEPKEVKIGRRFGDQVEIEHGLAPGDQIVVSGNFLLDSESRIKLAASDQRPASAKDPVCGMKVDTSKAREAGRHSAYQGQTYYFCNEACKSAFDAKPDEALQDANQTSLEDMDQPPEGKHLSQHP